MRETLMIMCLLAMPACGSEPSQAVCPEVTLDGEPVSGDCEVWSQPAAGDSVRTTYLYRGDNVRVEVWTLPGGQWSAAYVGPTCASLRAYTDSCIPSGDLDAAPDGEPLTFDLSWSCDCGDLDASL